LGDYLGKDCRFEELDEILMNSIEICIAFVAAIIGVGTPLVFQVVSKFDEKYNSEDILNLFERLARKKHFQILLKITVSTIAFYILISVLLIHFNFKFEFIITCMLSCFLIASSVIMVWAFIHFSLITIKFSRQLTLFNLLIKLNEKSNFTNPEILRAIADFSLNTIQRKDFPAFQKIINHFIDVFKKFENELEKPEEFYEIGYKITRELANYKNKNFDQFKWMTVQYLWMTDLKNNIDYNRLWKVIVISVENQEDEIIYNYWKKAYHYYEYDLKRSFQIYPGSDEPDGNKKIITNKFIDFHYYLGGLLLYENRIGCIKKIWDYTTSQPPNYPLLPFSLADIFERYFYLCKIHDNNLWENATIFRFPRIDSVDFDWIINSWIRKYLILLFLRQYTLFPYHIYDKFLELPVSPSTQAEKMHWIDNIQRFKKEVEKILDNAEMIKTLQFDFINRDWCNETRKPYPIDLVDKLENQLTSDFNQVKKDQSISKEKERKFWDSSKRIIIESIEEYKEIVKLKSTNDVGDFERFFIGGLKYFVPKENFCENQEVDHLNYDSFISEIVANNIRNTISETFAWVSTKNYLLKEEDVFPAIEKLTNVQNPNDFVIIAFRQNINYYINVLNVPNLTLENFNEIQLVNAWKCNGLVVGGTFFILKKSDLPLLKFKKPKSTIKKTYSEGEKILENVFASIIDLNKDSEIKTMLEKDDEKENLEDKVLASIEMNAELLWKKGAKLVSVRVSTGYKEYGLPNKLEEIKSFVEL
jgi:hypothetical protein